MKALISQTDALMQLPDTAERDHVGTAVKGFRVIQYFLLIQSVSYGIGDAIRYDHRDTRTEFAAHSGGPAQTSASHFRQPTRSSEPLSGSSAACVTAKPVQVAHLSVGRCSQPAFKFVR